MTTVINTPLNACLFFFQSSLKIRKSIAIKQRISKIQKM